MSACAVVCTVSGQHSAGDSLLAQYGQAAPSDGCGKQSPEPSARHLSRNKHRNEGALRFCAAVGSCRSKCGAILQCRVVRASVADSTRQTTRGKTIMCYPLISLCWSSV